MRQKCRLHCTVYWNLYLLFIRTGSEARVVLVVVVVGGGVVTAACCCCCCVAVVVVVIVSVVFTGAAISGVARISILGLLVAWPVCYAVICRSTNTSIFAV